MEQNLADLRPYHLAAQALQQIEQEEAAAGFEGFRATDEIPSDLQAKIDDGVPAKMPAKTGQQSALLERETILQAQEISLQGERSAFFTERIDAHIDEGETLARNTDAQVELEALQIEFISLKSEIGTKAALRQILAKATIPEAQRHIRAVLGTIGLLQTDLPSKAPALMRLLNTTNLDLNAATLEASFVDILLAAGSSPDFTAEDVATLRQVVAKQEIYMRTGSHVQVELGQTQLDENGMKVPAHPESDPLQFREHVAGFTELDGTQKLRAITTHGERVTLDITSWSGSDVGRASELLQLWAMTENEGQTGYLTSITKLNWSGSAQIDPLALQQASQIVSAMLGHGEGRDGDIFNGGEALGLIRWPAQLANPHGGTVRNNRNAEQTHDALQGLGIRDEEGNLDLNLLRAFGDYSRNHSSTAPNSETVRAYLDKRFPERVGRLS